MHARATLDLLLCKEGASTRLLSPEVGLFTCALERGALLGPGQPAGVLLALGRATQLCVPPGVSGRITSPRPERLQEPVAYGTVLYELSPLHSEASIEEQQDAPSTLDGLIVRCTQAGRFYQRPSPDEAAYVEVGGELVEGQAVGLLEIMKTFSQVSYAAVQGLPARAKFVRWLVEDGAEVRAGDGLLEVEAR